MTALFNHTHRSKVVHIFRKISTDEKSGKKKKKQVRSSQGHIEGVCEISRSESQKRRRHSPANTFEVFIVNQPVRGTCCGTKFGLVLSLLKGGEGRGCQVYLHCARDVLCGLFARLTSHFFVASLPTRLFYATCLSASFFHY